MHIPTPRYRGPLARLQPEPMDVEAVKRQGWRELRVLVVGLDDERLDWAERELIRRIGERLYGSRNETREARHG
ncbi:hypothetical protein [Caldimonas manganoxidans]|uniref:hypothetical protein n=1 Tax=Caldimonas manganoxidans TaxID=196015 RepID=UPI0003818261|nr:hypothetical protein [Caldimonas manganoxidans]